MIALKPFDEQGRAVCLRLDPGLADEDFVDPVEFSLQEAEEFGDAARLFAICRAGTVIGFASLYVEHGFWQITNFLIDRAYQRKGFGTEAARLCIDYLIRSHHAQRVSAPVHLQNTSALHFWESMGFQPSDTIEGDYMFMRFYPASERDEGTVAYTIERVKPGDEAALAYIQTESWKAGFKDILSPDTLQRCTRLDKATAMYRRLLEQHIGHGYLLHADGRPHCIAWWDATREQDMPGYAELICIHSLPDRWRQGYGSKMMDAVLHDMAAAGYARVMLWVFEENTRARRFYEAHGFATVGKVKPNVEPTEILYEKLL